MIKIQYSELEKYLYDENRYQLRIPYAEDDIVYPLETFRSPETDEYIIYIRHKVDPTMIAFTIHCYTNNFAGECYNYIKSVCAHQERVSDTITIILYSDFFMRFLSNRQVNIVDIDITPSFVVTNISDNISKKNSDIKIRKACKDDISLIDEFIKADPSKRNDIENYMLATDNNDVRCAMFIALKDDSIIGYLVSAPYNNDVYVEVQDIYVAINYRGKGYGTLLATTYVEYITKLGYKALYSDADNHASLKVALNSGFKFDHLKIVSRIRF